MARPTPRLIAALRSTAARLRRGDRFQWTHMGACICGNLAHTVTKLSREEIHRMALQRAGDWSEQAYEYCPQSGLPIDHVLGRLIELGLTPDDIRNLERLRDRAVCRRIDGGRRELHFRNRDDVIAYLEAWAELLDEQLAHPSTAAVA